MGIGIFGSDSKGKSATKLAQRAKPPAMPALGGCLLLLLVIIMFCTHWIAGVVALVPLILWGIYTNKKHRAAMASWERTWLCERCGGTFLPDALVGLAKP